MVSPVNQEIVNDTAKLVMHRLIARAVSRNPKLVEQARIALAGMARRFPNRSFVKDWDDLLRLPPGKLRLQLTSHDQEMARLRSSSPFMLAEDVDFSEPALRRRIGRAAKRIATRGMLRQRRRRIAGPSG